MACEPQSPQLRGALTEYETAKKSNARDPAMSLQVDLDRRGIAKLI
jgi:hypothetical protein